MDQPISSSSTQQKHQFDSIETTKSSIYTPAAPVYNQTLTTPRRPLDDNSSPEYQSQRQVKKARPHEPTPTNVVERTTTLSTERQFKLPAHHIRRALANNLPCFYFNFSCYDEALQQKIPSAMKLAHWIRQILQQQSSQLNGDFSLLVPAGNNRYKVGVTSKTDFLKLWNCHWPEHMDGINVEIERPRALPDCCSLVLRYVPGDLSNEFVHQEILKTIKSAVLFTKIKYYRPRSTHDYKFSITDENEYDEMINISRISIGHVLLPVTEFIPGLKMTFCFQRWKLGHTRSQYKISPRCRNCLEAWNRNHQCVKPVLCAQCQGQHFSLSMECSIVKNYRQILKEEVNNTVKGCWIKQVNGNKISGTLRQQELESPPLNKSNGTNLVWGGVRETSVNPQHNQHKNDQVSELAIQINNVLDITRRMEIKMDKQVVRMDLLDKTTSINKEGIIVLDNIIQQTINAVLEKKNKQQLLKVSRQIEEFKEDMIEKFNSFSTEQQLNLTSPSLHPNKIINSTTTATFGNGNIGRMEEEQLMETTDEQ